MTSRRTIIWTHQHITKGTMVKRTVISAMLAALLCLSRGQPGTDTEVNDTSAVSQEDGITPDIPKSTKGILHMLLGGDIVMRNPRNAMNCANNHCLWKKSHSGFVEVPYVISNFYYDNEKRMIEMAMQGFHAKTCIRFIPRTSQLDYLSIESKLGCSSPMGRTGGKQVVSLDVSRCIKYGAVQHELNHALGFNHEHTRSDRDMYVRINWENIPKEVAHDFDKQDTKNLDTPYDYYSIMHYSRNAYSRQYGKDTITPIHNPTMIIGQRHELSKIDILKINKLYGCNVW